MTVWIQFNDRGRDGLRLDDETEGKEACHYHYELLAHGFLVVYKQEHTLNRRREIVASKDVEELAVYNPSAWFAVGGSRSQR
ncbi:hypothetical protein ACSCB1_09150 [Streptomyces europaeiscabiei]|uniref:Uncharacterized protein n=1 Tax=Streptomyces europaeiscabiei TaxID=146819 RepID=A0ABU4N6V8_9ACTN|nr:hypothetical protein [Streptomyces europaeiscabiei]MDX2527041.1 hypothetical protein [Streptomyces europaeiscabiei]MDX2757985.1 hypothetical protein [Streptomyces europaeiscabiei]MDX2769090.1 hypothetical protein [Streptomyces europaeiscabiei]MDX3542106.1 hypothetical protein [Streptomyces europaeiscabiei]MDX3551154.1 hypothetical protein [Streptomyces europaeiscabiei]